ncbi:MAG: PQQ-dependent sugar dehydrogenase [Bacteroidota bacterium]
MNKKMTLFLALIHCGLLFLSCKGQDVPSEITIRNGYSLSLATDQIKNPRFMLFGPDGTLYVSQPRQGDIKACRDENGDGVFESIKTFVSGHKTVHDMYWHEGWLWFAESGAVFKAQDTNGDGVADKTETILAKGSLPEGGGHWHRPVLIMNSRLYTGIGCSGNLTEEGDTDRMKIWTYDLSGRDKQLFASGLRNTEKLVIRPGTEEIWGMDHGSDWFGGTMEKKNGGTGQPITDMNPFGEMNHIVAGAFYGHPYITGFRVPRYEFMDRDDIVALAEKTTVPEWGTGAHWAPNAMAFYDGEQFPDDVRGDAFVAFHGSWNRSEKSGYCVSRVLFDQGKPYGELVYVNFISSDGSVLGRPVDVINAPDGSLLISDDQKSKIYRLSYGGK